MNSDPNTSRGAIWAGDQSSIATTVTLLLVAIATGLFVRYQPLAEYRATPGYDLDGIPILTPDSYLFTRYAREYLQGEYSNGGSDNKRCFPDGLPYPRQVPMISWLAAWLHRICGIQVDKVAFHLPAILAPLVAIPLMAYQRSLKEPLVVFGGAILGVTSFAYVCRSSLGYFDTDCLNLFFLLLICCFLQFSSETPGKRGIILACVAGLAFLLFDWWFGHSYLLLPLLVVFILLLVVRRKQDSAWNLLLKVMAFSLVALLLDPAADVHALWANVRSHITQTATGTYFPNLRVSVGESQLFGFITSLKYIHSVPAVSVAGLFGLVWLIVTARSRFLSLLPTLLIGLFTFIAGVRFTMYLAPFIGMGMGFLASRLEHVFKPRQLFASVALRAFLAIGLVAVCLSSARVFEAPRPMFNARVYHGLKLLADEKAGVVWTWWDWGYAIQDLADQATCIDGGLEDLSYFVACAFIQQDARAAYNIMTGVTSLGWAGLEAEMAKNPTRTPDELVRELAAGKHQAVPNVPIYVMVSFDMMLKFSWAQYLSSWDFHRGQPRQENTYVLLKPEQVNVPSGLVRPKTSDGRDSLQAVRATWLHSYRQGCQAPEVQVYEYPPNAKSSLILHSLEFNSGPPQYLLATQTITDSVFHHLFVLADYPPSLFEMVYDDFPVMRVYRLIPPSEAGMPSRQNPDQRHDGGDPVPPKHR